jgi:hypothetical protein
MRTAIQTLIDLCIIANTYQSRNPVRLGSTLDDTNGEGTIKVLQRTKSLVERVTGNSPGSLGLHPAIYFYGPSGRHSSYMFMGTMELIAKKVANNDSGFNKKFASVRGELEEILIQKKDLLSTIIQRHISSRRSGIYASLLEFILSRLINKEEITDADIVSTANLEGKIVVGSPTVLASDFSESVKSKAFITSAIRSAQRCSICNGFLDPTKSVTYDHIKERKNGGVGSLDNCSLVHPYCNTGYKNSSKT